MCKRHLVIICLLVCCLSAVAQNEHKQMVKHVKSKVDSILDAHIKIKVDTNYITRPATNWTLKVRTRGYLKFISMSGEFDNMGKFQSQINSPLKTTIGICANYRGLSATLSVNPAKLFEKNSSRDLNLSFYNNRYGADFSYLRTEDLTTKVSIRDEKLEIKLNDSYLRQISASAYYVFNGKKFSYPAAFTHSWVQHRSAGSFLLSAAMYMGTFSSSFDDQTGYLSPDKKITMKHASIGGGYAYNYVPNKKWLLHFSLVPHVILWHNYQYSMTLDPETNQPLEKKTPYKYPGGGGTGRFGATYSWKNYFTGFSSVIQSSFVGNSNDEMRVGNTQWKAELFLGLRL